MKKTRLTAGILALFGGFFGLHKFYLKEAGAGFFYIFLFFMTSGIFKFPVSFLLGLFDALRIFSMSDEQFDRKYNKGRVSRRSNVERRRKTQMQKDVELERKRYQYNKSATKRENPFKKSGIRKLKEFELDGAIHDLNKALEIAKNDADIHYELAKAYSLSENKENAFYHLDLAVAYGFNKTDNFANDDELAFLRIQKEYEDFKNNNFRIDPLKNKTKISEADLQNNDLLLSQLNKLAELRKKGLLSEKEFIREKEKLLTK